MNRLTLDHPPQRVVSLVPSMTESLFELGLGASVVGITDYCIHPAEQLAALPRLGGPKNPDVPAILALKPDLVIANREENTPKAVEELEQAGIAVWVSFPKTARQAVEVLWELVEANRDLVAGFKLNMLERALGWSEAAVDSSTPRRVFCPIWQDTTAAGDPWWMTFNGDTYPHDVLRLAGGLNIFADRERRYPLEADLGIADPIPAGERDTRYPRVTVGEVRRLDPEVILLPSEPFSYDESSIAQFEEILPDVSAVRTKCIYPLDGSLLTWHGTRLALALRELPALLQRE